MRKKYVSPTVTKDMIPNEVTPLAFFSAATAAAAVAGAVVGAVATGRLLGNGDKKKERSNWQIVGLCA